MTGELPAMLLGLAAVGVVGGIVLLLRGFGGYRSAIRVGDTSTSRIASLAAGEVRLTGAIEPAEVTLTSPLQARECVWYRSKVSAGEDQTVFEEERAIGFASVTRRVRSASFRAAPGSTARCDSTTATRCSVSGR